MSLNEEERRRTAAELRANQELCGLPDAEVGSDLGFSPGRLARTMAVSEDCEPADVWLLRDLLEQAARAAGREPRPFTVLTERSRAMASVWFPLRSVPRGRFGASDRD